MFLRFPECPFLLHGVEHSVAILSLVLVQTIVGYFILCVHITKCIIYSMYIFQHVHKNIAISNTGYDVALHDKYANTYNQ